MFPTPERGNVEFSRIGEGSERPDPPFGYGRGGLLGRALVFLLIGGILGAVLTCLLLYGFWMDLR